MTLNNYVVIAETGCWTWSGGKTAAGYGRTGNRYAHRLSYEQHRGRIPDGLQIDHLCRNRACINPDHLEAVTQQENIRRATNAITHCPSGHAYTKENTYVDDRGARRCRRCAQLGAIARAGLRKARRHSRELHHYRGHSIVKRADRDWACKCGFSLAETRDAAVVAMRSHRKALTDTTSQ